jgi:hypothetical protein
LEAVERVELTGAVCVLVDGVGKGLKPRVGLLPPMAVSLSLMVFAVQCLSLISVAGSA